MIRSWTMWVASTVLLPTLAFAAAPMLLNYQGNLSDSGGAPENGTFNISFEIYDAASGGNPLPAGTPWSETQSVAVVNGEFSVLLGSVTPLPTSMFTGGPSDSAGPLRFLQVAVSGETLTPRRRIGSAAYALSSGVPGYLQCKRFDTATTVIAGYTCNCSVSNDCGSNPQPYNHTLNNLPLSWMSYFCSTTEPGTTPYFDTVPYAFHPSINTYNSLPYRYSGCTDAWTGVGSTLWCCK